jgi:aminoglycoside phosphotransferase (APT) family kinase protein
MIASPMDSDVAHIVRLAFGRPIPATPIPLAPDQYDGGLAFALHGPDVPPRVILQRYSPREQVLAFRAFAALRALHERHFAVPDVYYLGWSYYTRYVLLLTEYIEGRGVEGQAHAFFARIGPHFAETLAQLHRLTWNPPPDLAMMPLGYAFHDVAERVRHLNIAPLNTILDWLLERVGHVNELPPTVIHGNYVLHNVLAAQTRIVAVYGWEHAKLADPRFDVGLTSATLGAYGVALSDQFMEAYTAAAGPVADSAFWDVFSALSLLARTARSLSTLRSPQRDHLLQQTLPVWRGLLLFIMHRTGLDLL